MVRRVFLVGFMGCGKSSLGRSLATRTGWQFIDTDNEIERRAGRTIPEIFAQKGEEWFRSLERQVIEDASIAPNDAVVALGGGAACGEGVMEMLAKTGTTIYLKTTPEKLIKRMGEQGRARRPKIAGMGDEELLSFIEKLLPEREKYYNKATFVVDSEAVSDEVLLRVLLQHIDNTNV